MDTQNNIPTANPMEVAVRDLCGKVDAYLKQGCLRSELYHVNERVKAFLDTLPEQPKLKPMNIPSAGGGMSTTPPKFKLDVKPEQSVDEPEYYQHFDPDC